MDLGVALSLVMFVVFLVLILIFRPAGILGRSDNQKV